MLEVEPWSHRWLYSVGATHYHGVSQQIFRPDRIAVINSSAVPGVAEPPSGELQSVVLGFQEQLATVVPLDAFHSLITTHSEEKQLQPYWEGSPPGLVRLPTAIHGALVMQVIEPGKRITLQVSADAVFDQIWLIGVRPKSS